MVGAIWNPLAPAPIMATRLPARSTRGPSGPSGTPARRSVSCPGMSGMWGRFSWPDRRDDRPGHQRRPRCRRRPGSAPSRWPSSSSQTAPSTSVSQRTWGSMPCLSITAWKYALELGLLGEELRPVVARLEAVAVEVVADVDPGARVGVLPPGAADPGVLLHDGEGDAGLLQPDAGQQSRLAAADDHDREGVPGRRVAGRLDPAGVGARRAPSPPSAWGRTRRAPPRRRATSSSRGAARRRPARARGSPGRGSRG